MSDDGPDGDDLDAIEAEADELQDLEEVVAELARRRMVLEPGRTLTVGAWLLARETGRGRHRHAALHVGDGRVVAVRNFVASVTLDPVAIDGGEPDR